MAGLLAGRARGAPRIPLQPGLPEQLAVPGGQSRARSPAPGLAVPHRCPMAPQMVGQGLPITFVSGPCVGARGAGSIRKECPCSMPTMLGLTALKSGCHIPSGQPFTSICGGLVRLPPHSANTNTALNPPAPTVLGCRADWLQATHQAPRRATTIPLQHPQG